ncbi:hypothetical protein DP73_05695 [Desulfosporosinus sp. HMP52]|uniref:DUF6385 domain-containing protein n=1 Tax=Desulfosporosinus sp. HMP52 TaxID=1487923 RepID=UPI00051F9BFA|nr:DUF6385 domain-containing protein [Desulfosporosinus sp. HMP52]KGK90946.1 hypothetical protein DP73_05695 [Desulfosporosinus sp. HMP52]
MTDENQVYNSHFLFEHEGNPNFPDGWARIGGDRTTKWEWVGSSEGQRAVKISHPQGPRAGIILENNVMVPAGEGQRWEVGVVIQTEPAEVSCYIRIYLGAVSQYMFTFCSGLGNEKYSRVFSTPPGVNVLRVEVGVLGEGVITIHEIQGRRLYPKEALRLDEKGQIYIRHIESIGKIQAPMSSRLVSPLPLPVDVIKPIKADLRELTPSSDGIRIYGSNGNPIESTIEGSVQVKVSGRVYIQSVEQITSTEIHMATIPKDVSELSVFSYAVQNMGNTEVTVQLQISPDGAIWTADDIESQILPGTLAVITPNRFLRYVRLIYTSALPADLIVWFQAQC